MYNVLINAYAVSPNWGSEPGMGWNWVTNLARYCNLHVITEGEWRDEIEKAVESHPNRDNLHFHYLPVSDEIRKMCWNQGDWRFYKYYRDWQKRSLALAREIVSKEKIDVLHQLNMIGFREPGLLWKIKDIPFVWGPVGGMEMMSTGFLKGEPMKLKIALYVKNFLNNIQRRYQSNVINALNRAGGLSAATKGVYDFISEYHQKDVVLLNETGCYERELPKKDSHKECFDIVWVGKFDFRKQVGLAIECLARLKDCKEVRLHIIGPGSDSETKRYHELADRLGVNDMIVWHGRIPNAEVQQIMREGDVFLFTSIMEGTPHVVLEAIQNGLPVICFDACGQSGVVNDKVGIKIAMSNKADAIRDFADAVRKLHDDRDLLHAMVENCGQRQTELSWDSKAKIMVGLYEKATDKLNGSKLTLSEPRGGVTNYTLAA